MSEEKDIRKILGRRDEETIATLESQLAAMSARAEAAEHCSSCHLRCPQKVGEATNRNAATSR